MTQIVALDALIQIVQHHDGCHEVDHLASRQVIQVVAAVSTSIAVSIASERQSRSNGFEKDAEKDDRRKWMSQREGIQSHLNDASQIVQMFRVHACGVTI